jgi:hypothetical protein
LCKIARRTTHGPRSDVGVAQGGLNPLQAQNLENLLLAARKVLLAVPAPRAVSENIQSVIYAERDLELTFRSYRISCRCESNDSALDIIFEGKLDAPLDFGPQAEVALEHLGAGPAVDK